MESVQIKPKPRIRGPLLVGLALRGARARHQQLQLLLPLDGICLQQALGLPVHVGHRLGHLRGLLGKLSKPCKCQQGVLLVTDDGVLPFADGVELCVASGLMADDRGLVLASVGLLGSNAVQLGTIFPLLIEDRLSFLLGRINDRRYALLDDFGWDPPTAV